MDDQSINFLGLDRGEERYLFLYDDDSREALLRVLGRFAAHRELSFTWYDCAVLSQRVRAHSTTPPLHHSTTPRF